MKRAHLLKLDDYSKREDVFRRASGRAAAFTYIIISVVAFALIGRTFYLVYHMARPMPYWDAWEFMKALPAIYDGGYTLHDLFGFQNEHRIVTTRLIMLADVSLFAGTGYLSTALLVVLLCGIGTILTLATVDKGWRAVCVAALTISLLLSVAHSDNFSSGFQIQFPLVDLLAIVSIGLFVLACGEGRNSWMLLAAAVVADILAIGSMASGNVIVGAILLVAILLRAHWSRLAAFLAAALSVSAAYFMGYPTPEVAHSYKVVAVGHFAVNYLGSMLRGYSGAALYLGAVLLLAYMAILMMLARSWWRRDRLDPVLVWLAGIAAFVVAGAVITATGRVSLGMEVSITSRYALQSLLFASCLFLMVWRMTGSLRHVSDIRLGLAVCCLLLAAASTLAAGPIGEWRRRVADYDIAGNAFASGVFTDDVTKGVYPRPELIQAPLRFMAAHQLGPFSDRYATMYRLPMNAIVGVDVGALPICTAVSDSSRATAPDWFEVDGWAFNPVHVSEGAWIVALDANRHMVGFANEFYERPDVARAFHFRFSRVGFHLSLNIGGRNRAALKDIILVLLPQEGRDMACRMPFIPSQPG